MASLRDLQAKMKENAALAARFAQCKNADDFIELAEAEGYEITEDEIEQLTEVSIEDLQDIAGGISITNRYFVPAGND